MKIQFQNKNKLRSECHWKSTNIAKGVKNHIGHINRHNLLKINHNR